MGYGIGLDSRPGGCGNVKSSPGIRDLKFFHNLVTFYNFWLKYQAFSLKVSQQLNPGFRVPVQSENPGKTLLDVGIRETRSENPLSPTFP